VTCPPEISGLRTPVAKSKTLRWSVLTLVEKLELATRGWSVLFQVELLKSTQSKAASAAMSCCWLTAGASLANSTLRLFSTAVLMDRCNVTGAVFCSVP